MRWATKRKLEYFSIIAVLIIVFVGLPLYFFVYQKPTCFDKAKNGDETGIDCGGSCRLLCSAEVREPIARWDPRIFRISPGIYSVLSYFDNPNVTGEVLHAPYTLKLYDSAGVLVSERSGETFIPKGQTFAIYEPNFNTGERIPTRAIFSFAANLVWTKNLDSVPELDITNKALQGEDKSPRIDAQVTNNSSSQVQNIELVAIINDSSGNAIGASRTLIEKINPSESTPIVFTWPLPFVTKQFSCFVPVDVALLLDRSGSMRYLSDNPPQPLTDVKSAAITFVNNLHSEDQGALVTFSTTATNPVDSQLTKNFKALKEAILKVSIFTDGTQETNIFDSIEKAQIELESVRHNQGANKVIVLLTDGVATKPLKKEDPKYPENSALGASNRAKSAGIRIFTIGLGKDVNAEFLKNVASDPQSYFGAPSAGDLVKIYSSIATAICERKPASIEILSRIYPKSIIPAP